MTAVDAIDRALRLLGVYDPLESASDAERKDGLTALNDMINDWGSQRLTIHTVTRTAGLDLVSGTQEYTIGSSGTFNLVRPSWIEYWGVVPDPSLTDPLELAMGPPLTVKQWARVPVKSTSGPYPTALYYDYGFASSLGTISVYPVPDSSTPDIVLYTPTAIIEFADLSTTSYLFPPGYRKAIIYNLALELAPEFGVKQINPLVIKGAEDSFANIKRANIRMDDLRVDDALLGGSPFDWQSGDAAV